jgi:hypothetical protein
MYEIIFHETEANILAVTLGRTINMLAYFYIE